MAYQNFEQWLKGRQGWYKDKNVNTQAEALYKDMFGGGTEWKMGGNPFGKPYQYTDINGVRYDRQTLQNNIYNNFLKDYRADKAIWEKEQNDPTTNPPTIPSYDPYAEQRAREEANIRAEIDNQLNRFDSYFKNIDDSRDVRKKNINEGYNQSLFSANKAWGRAQEDYNTATNNRLRNRQRQLGVADDDFKKQRDAYDRYFARMGAGSSSAAQYAVPTLLARAASKVRNEIEDTNAENEREQTVSFNRAKEDHEENLANLGRTRSNALSDADSDWSTARSSLLDKQNELRIRRGLLAGKSYAQVQRENQGLIDEADRLKNEAIKHQAIKPEFQIKAVGYKPTIDKDWSYTSTETKVDNPAEDKEQQDDAYSRYFRDREEEKKRKGWIPTLG